MKFSCKIKTTGAPAGDEVVRLYIRNEFASLPRPVKALKGFTRVHLQQGEEHRITFHLNTDQLAFYDENLEQCLEPGRFLMMLGASSEDIRLTGDFSISGEHKTSVKDRVFVCPLSVQG